MNPLIFVFAILRNHLANPLFFLNCTLEGEQLYNVRPILEPKETQYLYFVPPSNTFLEDGYCYYDMTYNGTNFTSAFLIHYDHDNDEEWYGITTPFPEMANITIFASRIVEYMIFPPVVDHRWMANYTVVQKR